VLNHDYEKECDIWSIGVIIYILLSGTPPFTGENDMEIFDNIMECNYNMDAPIWKRMSAEVKDLIQRMLVTDPMERITI